MAMATKWLFHWLRRSTPARRTGTRRRVPSRSLALERLEERAVPAVSILNNGGGGYSGLAAF